ncbi:MAG: glutamate synthase subunit beta [Bacilli bacterium]|nr:glutamate synthase subunit beta [Bacilli bacterium]
MGKNTGFLDYPRLNKNELSVEERIKNFNDFHTPYDEKTQKEQAARCMNCGVPFCQSAMKVNNRNVGCPLSNLIPEWNHLIYMGLYEEAYKRLAKTAPFPEFTGNVCPALCEACCSCSINGDSVGVKANELFVIEEAFKNGWIKPNRNIVRNKIRVAVVGSGPAGLSAAKHLNDRGYYVTVFEKNDRFGGLLTYGIPNMKLEKSVVERRIKMLSDEGIVFVNNTKIGTDYSMENLRKDYDEIIFACGTSEARRLKAKGVEKEGVYYALDFLTKTTKNLLDEKKFEIDCKDKDVVILGGGDTGNDCVGTAVREGAKSITLLEIMKEPPETNTLPWPNYPNGKKTDYGVFEANTVYGHDIRRYETTIDEVLGDDKVDGVVIKKVNFQNGKFIDIEGSKETIPCDILIVSMGFVGTSIEDALSYGMESFMNRIKLDGFRYDDKISVCGDMKSGQSLVVLAEKDGIDCAEYVISKHN